MTPESLSYMAHPVAPFDVELRPVRGGRVIETFTLEMNLENAKQWLRALQLAFPETVVIAPWIPAVEVFDDTDPELRAIGITRDCYTAARCDRIVMVGGRVSSGMAMERDHMVSCGLPVFDLTHLGRDVPTVIELRRTVRL